MVHRRDRNREAIMPALKETLEQRCERAPARVDGPTSSMHGSAKFFATRGRVRVRGSIDGHELSLMALADGTHNLPVSRDIRKAVAKSSGDGVAVTFDERLS
jgi:Domain of unknown function (DUF1905)